MWSGHIDWQTPYTTPSVPVHFVFEARATGTATIVIDEPWRPFPGGSRYGEGPPDYEHNVTEMHSGVLHMWGPNLIRSLNNLTVEIGDE
jgi:hypothetical protein